VSLPFLPHNPQRGASAADLLVRLVFGFGFMQSLSQFIQIHPVSGRTLVLPKLPSVAGHSLK
jgi:hypothetical protein